MAHRRIAPTFAEQLRDVRARPVPPAAPVTPGRFDREGGLSAPDGTPLHLIDGETTPQAAQDAVRRGALLAWEPCGCGGGGRCHPEWVAEEQRARLDGPSRLRGRRGTPTWLALWTGPRSRSSSPTVTSSGATPCPDRGGPPVQKVATGGVSAGRAVGRPARGRPAP